MAWTDETLAVPEDVRERYPRVGDLCESTVLAEQDEEIEAYIAKAKKNIGRKLDLTLSSKYAGKEFDAPDMKDLIINPSVLKESAVADCLRLMFEDAESAEDDYNNLKKRSFEKEFREEYNIATALIIFDEDESGSGDKSEKTQGFGNNTFVRV